MDETTVEWSDVRIEINGHDFDKNLNCILILRRLCNDIIFINENKLLSWYLQFNRNNYRSINYYQLTRLSISRETYSSHPLFLQHQIWHEFLIFIDTWKLSVTSYLTWVFWVKFARSFMTRINTAFDIIMSFSFCPTRRIWILTILV